jgi:hypothetical protein
MPATLRRGNGQGFQSAPTGLAPIITDDHNDVDQAASPDRVVHDMGMTPQPQLDPGHGIIRAKRAGVHQCAPRCIPGKAGLAAMSKTPSEVRPQAVGADQRQAPLLSGTH